MEVFIKRSYYVDILLGQAEIKNIPYKKSIYNYISKKDNVYLIHNTFTKEAIALTKDEFNSYNKINKDSSIFKYFVNNHFYVPENENELNTFNQVYKTVQALEGTEYINGFNIFTTTDCNARCFYCFEAGIEKKKMTEQTALDIVEYIAKVSKGKAVNIRWFGGEPLYNDKVIDIIANGLKNKNIKFSSSITTNGYLFNSEIINRAKKIWNLKFAQITVDGTESNYNKIKNYIYRDGKNPYKIVTENIENLLRNDIAVNVQINLYEGNYEDAYDLVEELMIKYKNYDNFKFVASYVEDTNFKKKFSQTEIEMQFSRYQEFKNHLIKKGILKIDGLILEITGNTCLAKSQHSTIILPDGKLAKCDVHYHSSIYGDIYSNKFDKNIIESYQEYHEMGELCHNCPWLPNCLFIKKCPTTGGKPCDYRHRENYYQYLELAIVEEYNRYLKKKTE